MTEIKHLRGREQKLSEFGWSPQEATWVALVCLHSGLFTRAQFCAYFGSPDAAAWRMQARRFTQALLDRKLAVAEPLDGLPTTTRPCRIAHKSIYRALEIPNVRHRRTASASVLFRRLLSLDYVLDHPNQGWLPTEQEKVAALEALQIPNQTFPRRRYHGRGSGQIRHFPLKLPIALGRRRRHLRLLRSGPRHRQRASFLGSRPCDALDGLETAKARGPRGRCGPRPLPPAAGQEGLPPMEPRRTRRRVPSDLGGGTGQHPPDRAGRPCQRPEIPRPVRWLRESYGLPPDVARPPRRASRQKPHPHRPGTDLAVAPPSSGRWGLTWSRIPPSVFHVRGLIGGALSGCYTAHRGGCNIFELPSVTRSLSAILLSPFEFPPSSQRTRGRTGSMEGEVSDPPFFVPCTSRQARPCNTPCNTPLPVGGVAHFSFIPAGRPL